jgi:uncharacterized protein with HEPN domain
MSRRDASVGLRHMLDYAREAVVMVRGGTRADLDANRMLSLALVKLLEIIGEAANRVPVDDQARYPQIPWQQLIGLRNRLVHGYDQVDLDILWQIVASDLPELVAELERIVSEGETGQ